MFADRAFHNCSWIGRALGMGKKVVNKLKQRIKRNGTLAVKKRGKRR